MRDYMCSMIVGLVFAMLLHLMSIFFIIADTDVGIIMYSCAGILTYGLYVILDLRAIAERIEIDDYILGALTLYLDLMTLFVHILQALGKRK